jgi:threonine/homoserine/homoserine lactone efflux protein
MWWKKFVRKAKNEKTLKTVPILLGLVFLGIGWHYLMSNFNLFGDCGKSTVAEATSTDGNYAARALLVACGATTGDAMWVTLANLKARLPSLFSSRHELARVMTACTPLDSFLV